MNKIITLFLSCVLSACIIVPAGQSGHIKVVGKNQESASSPSYRYHARLYPANPAAEALGIGRANIDSQDGHSIFQAQIGALQFNGEASRSEGNRGIANGSAGNGQYMKCQYQMNAGGRVGTGVCTLSQGARFEMHITEQ